MAKTVRDCISKQLIRITPVKFIKGLHKAIMLLHNLWHLLTALVALISSKTVTVPHLHHIRPLLRHVGIISLTQSEWTWGFSGWRHLFQHEGTTVHAYNAWQSKDVGREMFPGHLVSLLGNVLNSSSNFSDLTYFFCGITLQAVMFKHRGRSLE